MVGTPNPAYPWNWSKQDWQDLRDQYATNASNSLAVTGVAANNILMGGPPALLATNAALGAVGVGAFIGSSIGWGVSSVMVAVSPSSTPSGH